MSVNALLERGRESTRHLETDMTKVYYQSHLWLSVIGESTKALQVLPKDSSLERCSMIYSQVQTLIRYTDIYLSNLRNKEKDSQEEFTRVHARSTQIYQELEQRRRTVARLEADLPALRSQRNDLDKQIEQLENAIAELKEKIAKEEKKRTDASTDWIPFVGFFGGLVTGRYTRMIPLYSVIEGIVSHFAQEKESCEFRINNKKVERSELTSEFEFTRQEIERQKNEISRIEKEIQRLGLAKHSQQAEIRQSGKDITALRNEKLSLELAVQRYELFLGNIQGIRDFIEVEDHELIESEVITLLANIGQTEKSLHILPSPEYQANEKTRVFSSFLPAQETKLAEEAPKWRLIAPGINFEGSCVFATCEAYLQKVWSPKGFETNAGDSTFNVMDEIVSTECPLCKRLIIDVTNIGFWNCSYTFEGERDKSAREIEEVKFTAFSTLKDHFMVYDQRDISLWKHLRITVVS